MTHRQRVLDCLAHRPTDRVPIAMVCSGINPPAYRALADLLASERGLTVEQYLEPLLDIRAVGPAYVGPALPAGRDFWGVTRGAVSYGEGAYDEITCHPLAAARGIADVEAYAWPRTEWFDYVALTEEVRRLDAAEPLCLMAWGGNPFEQAWYLRGFERTLEDLVADPDLADALLGRVTAFCEEHLRRQLEACRGRIDLVFTADDLGGQNGLLMSLDTWRRRIRPWHERLNAVAHAHGARVIYHTDGGVMPAVPGLVEAGIDVLQALQFDGRGMDPHALKERFGDRLGFQGGVSVQTTLPHGTEDDVRREVVERARVLGRGGGYIVGPSHAIQAGTPPRNVLALFDTATSLPGG